MKLYISYFYKIRFFPDNLIPVSTALRDPVWYTMNGKPYIDKRNVINGLRLESLTPHAVDESHVCSRECNRDYTNCLFLKDYYDYLTTLDFSSLYGELTQLSESIKEQRGDVKDVDICLMVYEAPSNKCSERGPLIRYFIENNVNIEEFNENSDV